MTAEEVEERLPILEAFADKKPLFTRRRGYVAWALINPDTTEFRFQDLDDREIEWSLTGTEA